MTVEKISNLELSEHAPVRVCKAGNVIEVKYLQHVNTRATVRKLSADFFQVVSRFLHCDSLDLYELARAKDNTTLFMQFARDIIIVDSSI